MRVLPVLIISLWVGYWVSESTNMLLGILAFATIWIIALLLAAKANRL